MTNYRHLMPLTATFLSFSTTCIKFIVAVCFVLDFQVVRGQNLIPNGDFELFDSCPNNMSQLEYTPFWFDPTFATADYFNSCDMGEMASVPGNFMGSQTAQSGNGYAGIFVGQTGGSPYREFIEVALTEPLIANRPYHIEYFVSLAEQSSCFPTNICMYLTNQLLTDFSTTGYFTNPLAFEQTFCNQEGIAFDNENNWIKMDYCFIASGEEKYLLIGNNYSDAFSPCLGDGGAFHSAYLYLDNISLIPMPVQTVYFDTAVCKGQLVDIDLTELIDEPDNTEPLFVWQDGFIGSKRTIKQNGMYIATVNNSCATDTIFVQIDYLTDCPEVFIIPNAFSPNQDGINDKFRITEENITITQFDIYNRYGKKIFTVSDYNTGWDGTINGVPADIGVYVYNLTYFNNISETTEIKQGYITLIR